MPLPEGPPFFKYADAEAAAEAMENAGFTPNRCHTREVPMTFQLDAAEDLYDLFAEAGVRMGAVLAAQTPEQREGILAAMRRGIETADATNVGLQMPCALSTGTKS